jgi:hypothetical protein
MSEQLRQIVKLDPAAVQAAMEAYMAPDKGYYMGGYIAG